MTAIEYALKKHIKKLEDYISELETAVARSGEAHVTNDLDGKARENLIMEITDCLRDYGYDEVADLIEEEFLCT